MTDREKLVELIDEIIELYPSELEKLADHLIAHGVMVKEPLKPLTVEEAKELRIGWIESRKENIVFPVLFSKPTHEALWFYTMRRAGAMWACLCDYGQVWRCWAEKPTEAEREAAEWEGV